VSAEQGLLMFGHVQIETGDEEEEEEYDCFDEE
jgi:hypothetical protein